MKVAPVQQKGWHMNEIQIFNSVEFGTIRTIQIDNEPWFVVKDLTDKLGYSNGRDAVALHVDEEDKSNVGISDGSQNRNMTIVNESGLYSLILSSKLEGAKKFRRWITSEVIPQIRKTGGYKLPGTYAEALKNLLEQVEANERLVNENETFKAERELLLPKAEFFDAVTDSKQAIPIGDVAKILDMGIGRNKLFEFMREEKILMPDNSPYQKYVDAGYFRIVEQKYEKNGDTYINLKTLVFQKGVDYIRKRLLKSKGEAYE